MSRLYVGNLPMDIKADELEDLFYKVKKEKKKREIEMPSKRLLPLLTLFPTAFLLCILCFTLLFMCLF